MSDFMGVDAVTYYNVGGVNGSGWVLLTGIQDETNTGGAVEVDVSERGDPIERMAVAMLTKETSIQVKWDPTNAGHDAIEDAHEGRTIIGLRFLHELSGKGFEADFSVPGLVKPRPSKGLQTADVTVKYNGNYTRIT